MGTSNQFGGAKGTAALIPTFIDDADIGLGPAAAPNGPLPPDDGVDTGAPVVPALPVPAAPVPRPVLPQPGDADRYRTARSNFTKFAGSGGTDRKSLGRAASHYVTKSVGGAREAARAMGSSRRVGAGLVNFLNDASSNGVRQALRNLDLESLAGRSIEEVFAGLADYICPEGGTIDEGIAREAFLETVADFADAGINDIDNLTPDQVKTAFELFATHAIEARLCNDIGTKIVTLPSDAQAARMVEAQLRDFIQRSVSDALNAPGINIQALSPDAAEAFVTDIYQNAFELLRVMGEREAGE